MTKAFGNCGLATVRWEKGLLKKHVRSNKPFLATQVFKFDGILVIKLFNVGAKKTELHRNKFHNLETWKVITPFGRWALERFHHGSKVQKSKLSHCVAISAICSDSFAAIVLRPNGYAQLETTKP
jgi:hypothetical protein